MAFGGASWPVFVDGGGDGDKRITPFDEPRRKYFFGPPAADDSLIDEMFCCWGGEGDCLITFFSKPLTEGLLDPPVDPAVATPLIELLPVAPMLPPK